MSATTPPPVERPKGDASGESLLREAMKNPGVQDLMRICDQWERFEKAAAPVREAMTPKIVTWITDSTCDHR